MFTWKPIFIELGQKLLPYRNRQAELLSWLAEMKDLDLPVLSLTDSTSDGTEVPLAEIDPFTFFANINRGIKITSRIEILRILSRRLGLRSALPQDFDGVPLANLQKAWFFPSSETRSAESIPLLWDLAEDVINREPTDVRSDVFERCLKIKQVGLPKLTMGMFWLRPDRYLALDQVNRDYLEGVHGFEPKEFKAKTFTNYLKILDAVRQRAGSDLTAISHAAYLRRHGLKLNPDALDRGFRSYLERLALEAGCTVGAFVDRLKLPISSGESEITNRIVHQKELADLLVRPDFTKDELKAATDKLWALTGRQDSIRRTAYFKSPEVLSDVGALLDDSVDVRERINTFIKAAFDHGYRPESGKDVTCPAQFASVILSSAYPNQFVDFRQGRWNDLYGEIMDPSASLVKGSNYGEMLERAGVFASTLASTPTFEEFFGKSDNLWTAAGVAWALKDQPTKDQKGNRPMRYWAGGFMFGRTDSKLDEFLAGNYWRHGYRRDSSDRAAKAVWDLFDQIKPGDEFAIKGYGGSADLNIKYVGRVTSVVPEEGRVNLERLDRILYRGKGPGGPGAGNWQLTLLEVSRQDVIDMIFKDGNKGSRAPLLAKNIILYGPPGTGKTYALRTDYMDRFTERGKPKPREQFADDLVADMAWWQVSTMVLLDLKSASVSQILSHPLMTARIRRAATHNVRSGVWAHLQMHTKRDCPHVAYAKRYEPLIFSKSEDSVWSIDVALATAAAPELAEALETWNAYRPSSDEVTRRYEFVTFHQSYSYEDFVEGIKPVLGVDVGVEVSADLSYEVKPGVFRQIAQRAQSDPEHEYAIFIDEINRGNVASIFGELITLIEEDKRLGQEHEIKVRLPYSREEFGVPPNLCLIGTMNTADRSVEALDTALRRRFAFISCIPDPTKLASDGPNTLDIDLVQLLVVINGRLERLLDRDHCVGHSYFMGILEAQDPLRALQSAFANKVLPLLEEYFFGDPGKIGLVLGPAFVRRRSSQQPFASCDWEDDGVGDRDSFERTDPMTLDVEAFRGVYESNN